MAKDERCEYPMEAGEDPALCGSRVGMCTENLCDYHCEKTCDCGGWALVEPIREVVRYVIGDGKK